MINIDENATLIITGINVERIEVKVNGRTNINVTAKTKVAEGEDVMVKAGYYDVKKREATGNISKVTAKEIEKQPVSNPIAALQGKGSRSRNCSNKRGTGRQFQNRIRGTNSIANGNDPLFIIDGVPYMSSTMSFRETSGSI
ncbi:MAG: TonB-dependent receptor plug domain-containing protein [Bacteroidota bacterium]